MRYCAIGERSSLGWERAAREMPDSNRLCIRELLMVASIGLPFSAWNPGTMPLCSTDISPQTPHSRLNWKCNRHRLLCSPALLASCHGTGWVLGKRRLTGAARSLCGAADCGLADSSYCTVRLAWTSEQDDPVLYASWRRSLEDAILP